MACEPPPPLASKFLACIERLDHRGEGTKLERFVREAHEQGLANIDTARAYYRTGSYTHLIHDRALSVEELLDWARARGVFRSILIDGHEHLLDEPPDPILALRRLGPEWEGGSEYDSAVAHAFGSRAVWREYKRAQGGIARVCDRWAEVHHGCSWEVHVAALRVASTPAPAPTEPTPTPPPETATRNDQRSRVELPPRVQYEREATRWARESGPLVFEMMADDPFYPPSHWFCDFEPWQARRASGASVIDWPEERLMRRYRQCPVHGEALLALERRWNPGSATTPAAPPLAAPVTRVEPPAPPNPLDLPRPSSRELYVEQSSQWRAWSFKAAGAPLRWWPDEVTWRERRERGAELVSWPDASTWSTLLAAPGGEMLGYMRRQSARFALTGAPPASQVEPMETLRHLYPAGRLSEVLRGADIPSFAPVNDEDMAFLRHLEEQRQEGERMAAEEAVRSEREWQWFNALDAYKQCISEGMARQLAQLGAAQQAEFPHIPQRFFELRPIEAARMSWLFGRATPELRRPKDAEEAAAQADFEETRGYERIEFFICDVYLRAEWQGEAVRVKLIEHYHSAYRGGKRVGMHEPATMLAALRHVQLLCSRRGWPFGEVELALCLPSRSGDPRPIDLFDLRQLLHTSSPPIEAYA